ncbi:MAG TPA: hypothetical protein VHF67_07555, partial [Gaiellaceae bacterium]|nr:hypothetical protein [Gaiellaceae bacterium]
MLAEPPAGAAASAGEVPRAGVADHASASKLSAGARIADALGNTPRVGVRALVGAEIGAGAPAIGVPTGGTAPTAFDGAEAVCGDVTGTSATPGLPPASGALPCCTDGAISETPLAGPAATGAATPTVGSTVPAAGASVSATGASVSATGASVSATGARVSATGASVSATGAS